MELKFNLPNLFNSFNLQYNHIMTLSQSINRAIKIYIASLQDPYSEALPTQAKRKITVLRWW